MQSQQSRNHGQLLPKRSMPHSLASCPFNYARLYSDAHTMILSKDSGVGELFILTTDGISSRDHARIGEDTAHKLWQEVDPHIRAILENNILRCLRSATPNSAMARQSSLETTLQEYLASATFDDDATIGVLVADKVFAHLHAKSKSAEGV